MNYVHVTQIQNVKLQIAWNRSLNCLCVICLLACLLFPAPVRWIQDVTNCHQYTWIWSIYLRVQSLPSSYVSFSLIKKGINKVILHVCEKSGRRAQDSIIDIWSLNTIMGFEQFKIYIKQLATVNHEDCHFKFRSRKRSKRILCFPLWRWKWEYIITICKFNELYDKIVVNIRGGFLLIW